ncbi:hypothetical protein ACP26L_09630 [Paenibacillus sp. S-38]
MNSSPITRTRSPLQVNFDDPATIAGERRLDHLLKLVAGMGR